LRQYEDITRKIDWITVLLFGALVLIGWLNIYAAVYEEGSGKSIFSLDLNSGKQFLWILFDVVLIVVILLLDFRTYESLAYYIFGFFVLLLLGVLFFGVEISGAKAWFDLKLFLFQPSEFAKFATALALAKFMSHYNFKFSKLKNQLIIAAILGVPALLILMQPDAGTTMVFASFAIVLYREGLSPLLIIMGFLAVILFVVTLFVNPTYLLFGILGIGITITIFIIATAKKKVKNSLISIAITLVVSGVVLSVDKIVNDVLQPHQQNRVKTLVDPGIDPKGAGYQVIQSKMAIGSGGFSGKGFLNGSLTKLDYIPFQSTDFIFCTLGEEHGWIGSFIIIVLFLALFIRIINISERQKSRFARIYGYGVASIMFMHFAVNIAMTIGLFPVIGIPLPFLSYGGSSLWAFTILLFILIKLDAHRMQIL
jgi:rod shape determining protein RodA